MSSNFKEKRDFPRAQANLKIALNQKELAKAIDFGEGGLSLSCAETISSPKVSLLIKFPGKEIAFKAKAQLVWQRDTSSGDSIYGVKFIKLDDVQKKALRAELVQTQLKNLLKGFEDKEAKDYILRFFSQDILNYIGEITALKEKYAHQASYSQELEQELENLNNKILLKGYCLELLLTDKKVLSKIKESFRELAGTWIYKSAIVKRAFEKPEGYPEDYQMLELIYQNQPVSTNIGLYFDRIFLKSPYAVSIRNRKNQLLRKIIDFVNQSQTNFLKVLSVCSGTGREISEAVSLFNSLKKVHFTFVETDSKALSFVKSKFKEEKKNLTFDFKPETVFKILEKDISNNYSRQNLIYTLGIIDYLSDRAAKKIIKIFYNLLEEGGQLILTHRNKDKTFPPIPPDWLCDWKVISRSKEEMENLFYQAGISGFSLSTQSDNFGYIHYFSLIKQKP